MKQSKLLMLGTAVALAMSSLSLSAVTPDELKDEMRKSRACPAAQIIEQEPAAEGYFSSFWKKTATVSRTVGEELVKPASKTPIGQVKEAVKDGFFAVVSAKIGFSLDSAKDTICNTFGKACLSFSYWASGEKAPQTIAQELGLNKSSKGYQIENALKTVAKRSLKADKTTAIEDFRLAVEDLEKDGYATRMRSIDVNAIYLNALAEEELSANTDLSCSAFVKAVQLKGFDALENINAVKAAPFPGEKLQVMDRYLKDAYNNIKLKQEFDNMRNKVIAAPAA